LASFVTEALCYTGILVLGFRDVIECRTLGCLHINGIRYIRLEAIYLVSFATKPLCACTV
jgi:hypothetical protein